MDCITVDKFIDCALKISRRNFLLPSRVASIKMPRYLVVLMCYSNIRVIFLILVKYIITNTIVTSEAFKGKSYTAFSCPLLQCLTQAIRSSKSETFFSSGIINISSCFLGGLLAMFFLMFSGKCLSDYEATESVFYHNHIISPCFISKFMWGKVFY